MIKGFAINMASAGLLATPRYREQQAWVKTEQRKSKLLIYLIGLALLAFFCSLFYIWSRIQMVNVGYEINRELHLKERLLEENKRLTLETAMLKSPVRLEALAKKEYGMDLPMKSQIVGDPSFQAPAVATAKLPKAPAQKSASPSISAPKPKAVASKNSVPKLSPEAGSTAKASVAKPYPVASEKSAALTAPKTSAKAMTSLPVRQAGKTDRDGPDAVTAPRVTKARATKVAALSNLAPGQ